MLDTHQPTRVVVTDINGNTTELDGDEIQEAIIAIVRREVTLVLPDRGRSVWPSGVVQIDSIN